MVITKACGIYELAPTIEKRWGSKIVVGKHNGVHLIAMCSCMYGLRPLEKTEALDNRSAEKLNSFCPPNSGGQKPHVYIMEPSPENRTFFEDSRNIYVFWLPRTGQIESTSSIFNRQLILLKGIEKDDIEKRSPAYMEYIFNLAACTNLADRTQEEELRPKAIL